MKPWDLALRTLYAEFQEAVLSRARLESRLSQSPTYVKKTIRGNVYWYRQTYRDRQSKQTYVGSSSPEREKEVQTARKERRETLYLLRKTLETERSRAGILRKAGVPCLDARTAILLSHFSSLGLIYECGVLIGSLAFSAYPPMLGYIFENESLKTVDIDVARTATFHPKDDSIQMTALFPKSLQPFKGIPSLNRKQMPHTFINADGLRVDLLIPLKGREKETYIMPGIAGAGAQALRMLDYLIEKPIASVLIGPRGGIPVTIPQPSRFAVHKLMTAVRRDAGHAAKRKKDFLQASQLLVACHAEQPEELKTSFKIALSQGKGWSNSIEQAASHLSPEAKIVLERI